MGILSTIANSVWGNSLSNIYRWTKGLDPVDNHGALDDISPDKGLQHIRDNQDKILFNQAHADLLPKQALLDDYYHTAIKDCDGFSQATEPAKARLLTLSDAHHALINAHLKPTPDHTSKITKLREEINLIKDDITRERAATVIHTLAQIRGKIVALLKEYHTTRLAKINGDGTLSDQTKADLKAELEAAHRKALQAYETEFLKELIAAKTKEELRFEFFMAHRNDEAVQKYLEALKPDEVTLTQNAHHNPLVNANFKDYGEHDLVVKEPVPGSFQITLNNRLTSMTEYFGGEQEILRKLRGLTDRAYATATSDADGKKYITLNIKHPTEEHARDIARKSYQAARESGYLADSTTIKVNSKVVSIAELFAGHASTLKDINARADKATAARERHEGDGNASNQTDVNNVNGYRRRLQSIRATNLAQAPAMNGGTYRVVGMP